MLWAVLRVVTLEGESASFSLLLFSKPELPVHLVLLCHGAFIGTGIWRALKGAAFPAQVLLAVCAIAVLHALWVLGAPIADGMGFPRLAYPLALAHEFGRAAIGGGLACLAVSIAASARGTR